MVTIKNFDNYLGDKITSTSAISNLLTNIIMFEDGSELTLKNILSAKEKYGICELEKIKIINELFENINKKHRNHLDKNM